LLISTENQALQISQENVFVYQLTAFTTRHS